MYPGAAIWNCTRLMSYPKPRATGGKLIRTVIGVLRDEAGCELPLGSHILCAVSGGADSTALALLIAKYGRRAVMPGKLSFLHINHGWRGKESDGDEAFVRALGKKLGIPVHVHRLKPPAKKRDSWEAEARRERKRIYAEEAKRRGARILTAHHADDQAETVLWRLMNGEARTHGGGILARHEAELRPLLGVRRALLRKFLEEEGQDWREDSTNHEGRFLRARMRAELFPQLERLFPNAVENLAGLARGAQSAVAPGASESTETLELLMGMAGVGLKRAHWEALRRTQGLGRRNGWRGEFHLADGWTLRGEIGRAREKWQLEKVKSLESQRKKRESKGP